MSRDELKNKLCHVFIKCPSVMQDILARFGRVLKMFDVEHLPVSLFTKYSF